MKKVEHLILGAGYAGVPIAFRLQRQNVPYLLINKRPYQTLTALIPELITGAIKDEDGILWLSDLLNNVLVAEVKEIDPGKSKVVVETSDGVEELFYSTLTICLGWVPDTIIPVEGVKVVDDLPSALSARELLFRAPGRVIVCGGGFVGVETAGQIAELSRHMGFEVVLVEAAQDILAGLPEKIRGPARRILEEKGVRIRCNSRLTQIKQGEVLFEGGDSEKGDIIIWSLGVKANSLVGESGLSVDSKGRGLVDEYLRSVDKENIFIAGDCAGTDLPMLGQVAVQQGKFLGEYLPKLAKGKDVPLPRFQYKGLAVGIGEGDALAAIGEKVCFSGLLAVVLKKIIGKKYFLDITL